MFTKEWKLIEEAYNGSGGFSNGEYILKYPRESEDKIKHRREVGYYPNIIASKIKRYNGFLFKRGALRSSESDIVRSIFKDADRQGNHIDIFMQNFALNAKIRGSNLCLIDNSSDFKSNNLEEQQNNREFPYLVEILPERVLKYKLDKFGRFDFISFSDTLNTSTYEEEIVQNITRYYDTSRWIVYDDEDNIIDSGDHNLGICPVIHLSESGKFPATGEFTQLAPIAKRHYNLKSELDEILRSQTFSILAVQSTDGNPNLSVGTDNALIYAGDKAPSFIAPSSSPTDAYSNEIESIESLIDKITYDINTSKAQESGIALDIKFQGLNSSLSAFASKIEDFELKVFSVISRYLDSLLEVNISYPKEFNIIDIHKELETLSMMKGIREIPSYETLKLKQIIKNDLNNLSEEDALLIDSDLEDKEKEVE